jgi:hypothetical protein
MKARQLFAPVALALALSAASPEVFAQTPEELRSARELFQEAFKDEQEKRYPEALEKFQRVAKVKESASVRYRIATVLAGMGRLREARDLYRALAAAKSSLPASDQETADSAAEKAAELDRKIPRLTLRTEDNPPPDLRVSVDGAPTPISATPRALELDPGDHVVAASARGMKPWEETLHLEEGSPEVTRTVALQPETAAAPPPAAAEKRDNVLPWVAIGGGAALVLGGTALLVAREGAIDDINATCPLRLCPAGQRTEVESDRDRAELFGPLGVTLGIVGLVAVGVGVYLIARNPKPTTAASIFQIAPQALRPITWR